jgi:hypothetical protein
MAPLIAKTFGETLKVSPSFSRLATASPLTSDSSREMIMKMETFITWLSGIVIALGIILLNIIWLAF